ncbi:MAG TPA: NADH-quinone oxidoreductase subunit H, partial [Candidatus Lustribacter sp.]|nr:NADH-quinone oxidoreductase subunit H [Candidatus Lustribacter sp.]
IQCLTLLAVAPLLVGVMRQVRARLEGRVGPGAGQPWRDLVKLAGKEPLQAPGTRFAAVMPVVMMGTSLLLVALLPLLATTTLPLVPDDLFVVVSVLLLGSVAIAILGLDSGTAFGGLGSSRHMTIAALVEPTVLVAVYALSIPVGTSALSAIVAARIAEPATVASPVSLLALVALVLVVIAETGRLPVDNPSTHLELTMVHEAMILESSGRDLGWVELASWLRLAALLGLVVNLAAPWGIAAEVTPRALGIALAALAVKLTLAGAAVAAVEVFLAKLRLFRVPELLAGSFVLAFLAVTASYLVA